MRNESPAAAARAAEGNAVADAATRVEGRPADVSFKPTLWPGNVSAPVPLSTVEATADAMLAFESETELAARGPHSRANNKPIEPGSARARRRLTWTQIALLGLALVVTAQAVLIAMWLGGRVAPPPETGSVTITSEPAGASVSIDGVTRGKTPVSLSLASGAHRVDVGGSVVRTQTVNVTRGGEASVHVELRPEPVPATEAMAAGMGGLHITTEPTGAKVWVDGEARGAAPVSLSNLKPGSHDVTVRAAATTVNRRVAVQQGSVASLIISMNAAAGFASGWLAISSPVPAQILEDGMLLGTTEMPRIMVRSGRHDLELTNAALGYRVLRTVQIAAGQTTSVRLEPPHGTLNLNALPWAEVWIDGQRVGETPIGNLSLAIGTHEVLFRHPDLGEQRRTVVVGVTAPVRLGVDLRK